MCSEIRQTLSQFTIIMIIGKICHNPDSTDTSLKTFMLAPQSTVCLFNIVKDIENTSFGHAFVCRVLCSHNNIVRLLNTWSAMRPVCNADTHSLVDLCNMYLVILILWCCKKCTEVHILWDQVGKCFAVTCICVCLCEYLVFYTCCLYSWTSDHDCWWRCSYRCSYCCSCSCSWQRGPP